MVEGARLEIVCALIAYREFESLTLRHFYSQNEFLFQVGPQCLGLAQWSLVNPVRSGRKQR